MSAGCLVLLYPCRHKDASLLQQVMQGLPFLCFVGEHSSAQDPLAWLKAGETTLAAWRAAEEELWTAQHADGQALAGRGVGQLKEPSQWPLGQQAGGSNKAADRQQNIQDDFFPGELGRSQCGSTCLQCLAHLPHCSAHRCSQLLLPACNFALHALLDHQSTSHACVRHSCCLPQALWCASLTSLPAP